MRTEDSTLKQFKKATFKIQGPITKYEFYNGWQNVFLNQIEQQSKLDKQQKTGETLHPVVNK